MTTETSIPDLIDRLVARRWSERAIARAMGESPYNINSWRRGRHQPLDSARVIEALQELLRRP